ncbi:hypothetical protein FH972_008559 [Carpinus fangiana]|uniref:Uncharacterized protein n=1 Tax=Carpinus fangiana TaxID=176857 RepID=A0A5N6QZZ4_9ROSI|nr:hypothetical protein FH972_008559 [Carpinus fangiana]
MYTKVISYPLKLGPELLKGGVASDYDGQTFLRASLKLLSIKESLTAYGEMDVGIERLEVVIKLLESKGSSQGSLDKQVLCYKGKEKADEEGDGLIRINGFKPKKKKKKMPFFA